MVVAAVLLVASVPHRGTAARSALSQGGPVQSTARAGEYRPQNVAAMVGPQLQELKALPVVKSFMAPSAGADRQGRRQNNCSRGPTADYELSGASLSHAQSSHSNPRAMSGKKSQRIFLPPCPAGAATGHLGRG